MHKPDPRWHEELREGGAPDRGWAHVQTFRPPPHVDVYQQSPLHLAPDCPLPLKADERAAGASYYWLYTFTIAKAGQEGGSCEAPTVGFLVKRQLPPIEAFPVYPDRSEKDDRSQEADCHLVALGATQVSAGAWRRSKLDIVESPIRHPNVHCRCAVPELPVDEQVPTHLQLHIVQRVAQGCALICRPASDAAAVSSGAAAVVTTDKEGAVRWLC